MVKSPDIRFGIIEIAGERFETLFYWRMQYLWLYISSTRTL